MKILIVNYHYYRDQVYKSGIYPISENNFLKQLHKIKKKYRIITQEELSDIIASGKDYYTNFAMITFDDGLKEQVRAYHLLKNQDTPGVFYIPTDAPQNKTCLEVHKLHLVRSQCCDEELYEKIESSYKISEYDFDTQLLQSQYQYDNLLSQKIKYFINFILNSDEKKELIDAIFKTMVRDERSFSKTFYMCASDIRQISLDGMIGTHTASHEPLATLSSVQIYENIQKSLRYLSDIDVSNVRSISYPYGGPSAVSNEVIRQASNFGFGFGLSMSRGINGFDDLQHRHLSLKRISCTDLDHYLD